MDKHPSTGRPGTIHVPPSPAFAIKKDASKPLVPVHYLGGPDSPILALGRKAAARALGIGERTLWTLTKEGKLPCLRIGRAVRYDVADLRAFIQASKGAGASL